jgi:hypothetical protein
MDLKILTSAAYFLILQLLPRAHVWLQYFTIGFTKIFASLQADYVDIPEHHFTKESVINCS